MRINTEDLTLARNYIQKYQFLISEYELVKQKKHPKYRYAEEFYKAHDTCRQSFLKYYNRYKQSGKDVDLLPGKRGPKWKTRRTLPFIEQKVISLRELGNNRYEINRQLKERLKKFSPSPSTVYNICKRYGMNRLTPPMKKNKRMIIKEKAGELAHIDTHYLNKGIVQGDIRRYYMLAVVDSCTRIAHVELLTDIKALTVMFSTMRCFQWLDKVYDIRFKEVLTDNGPEFGPRESKSKEDHPFERMLMETEVKHRYIRPYRPQTNGKVERFWKTIEEDMLEETWFDSKEHLEKELEEYLYYYNHERPHMGINGETPVNFSKKCQRII